MGSTNDDPSSTSGYYWNILAWINGLQTISYYIRLFGSFWCFCAKGANHKKLKINHQRLGTERWVSPLSISCIFLRVLHVHFSISQCSILGYPLVNIRKTMENNHFSWENSLFLWPFSIVMLVYQRLRFSPNPPTFSPHFPMAQRPTAIRRPRPPRRRSSVASSKGRHRTSWSGAEWCSAWSFQGGSELFWGFYGD